MSTSYLTKCPQCGSTFKINDQLLSAAGGKVRCGSCMTVFNAKDQLFDSDGSPLADKKSATTSHSQGSSAQAGSAHHGHSVIEKFGQAKNTPASDNPMSDWKPTQTPTDAAVEDPDDIIFEDDPEEDSEDAHYSGPAKRRGNSDDFDTDFLSLDVTRDHDFMEGGSDDIVPHQKASDESWAEKMLADELDAKKATSTPQASVDKSASPTHGIALEPMHDESPAVTTPPAPRSQEEPITAEKRPASPVHAPTHSPYEQYQSLRFDPIETFGGHVSPAKKLLIGLACVVLVLGIVLQFSWLHKDKLALYPQLRPAYEKMCNLLSCTLPDMVDVSAIRSQNLVVRSHPTMKNALLIDAVIINRAEFAQPFPSLVLFFSDLNNNVVTKRVFTPSEYLVGEAEKFTVMPIGTPIHLAIEVKDPGPEAVNYSLNFEKFQ